MKNEMAIRCHFQLKNLDIVIKRIQNKIEFIHLINNFIKRANTGNRLVVERKKNGLHYTALIMSKRQAKYFNNINFYFNDNLDTNK